MNNKPVTKGCSWKWEFLLYNAHSGYHSMCCDHDGETVQSTNNIIDITRIINHPSMISDRQAMLNGEELDKCKRCYRHITEDETIGGTMYDNHNSTPYSSKLKTLAIQLNITCLYTCVYCGEHNSSSWYSDADKNGFYQLHNKEIHKLSSFDKIQQRITVTDANKSKYHTALKELIASSICSDLSTLRIGGGEPLLYENLIDFITETYTIHPSLMIEIYTGLGVSNTILANFLNKTKPFKDKLRIVLSQEGQSKHAEFMRYGTNWDKWVSMGQQIKELGYEIEFCSVLNNMSLFTIVDFLEWKNSSVFKDDIVRIQPLRGPDYMSLRPLDEELHKELLVKLFAIAKNKESSSNFSASKYIPNYSNFERENLQSYLIEFSKRRNLDMTVLPNEFLDFLNGTNNGRS